MSNSSPKQAAIDIGTNSVLLLIAEKHGDVLHPIRQEARVTRLGEGATATDTLSAEAMDRTARALEEYVGICDDADVQHIAAVGTAAMRRAANADVFAARIRQELGIDIDIITEDEEARLTYRGSASSFGDDIVVMDIGGGSTEFITVDADNPSGTAAQSLDIGVVAIRENLLRGDPPTEDAIEKARGSIAAFLGKHLRNALFRQPERRLVAAAGTATTLAAMHARIDPYDPARVHGSTLSAGDIDELIGRLRGRTAREILSIPGVQAGREDVILPGALLMREAIAFLDRHEVTVSDHGVRWGVLMDRLAERNGGA